MRSFVIYVMLTVLSIQLLFACDDKNDSLMFSCNPVVQKAVASNLSTVRKMKRTDWLKFRQDFKRALYRAFTPAQRKEIWIDKFKELKNLDWSKEELLHIKKVEDFMCTHEELFTDKKLTDEQQNAIDMFFLNWTKEGELNLGWDKTIAISIAGTPCRTTDTHGSVEIVNKGLVLKYKKGVMFMDNESDTIESVDTTDYIGGGVEPNDTTGLSEKWECECADKVLNDFCIPLSCDSKWIKCEIKDKGCGWAWQVECNGLCI